MSQDFPAFFFLCWDMFSLFFISIFAQHLCWPELWILELLMPRLSWGPCSRSESDPRPLSLQHLM
jgi:hypothetical protein